MKYMILLMLFFLLAGCNNPDTISESDIENDPLEAVDSSFQSETLSYISPTDVSIDEYFEFIQGLALHYDTLLPYSINEYNIVHHNDWIIDTLVNTDYYHQAKNGQFIYNQTEMIVIPKNTKIYVPTEKEASLIDLRLNNTTIDLNIPEFKIRILEGDSSIFTFPARVGRNEIKYLAMAKREVDLRTKAGEGQIVRINRDPIYINPSNNHPYYETKRDDEKVTKLPRIPWLEPEINGIRHGQLIHPTTNPITLGKAYSNGCIGMREGDVWRLYYHAPIGTKVHFRYDLLISDENGNPIMLKDIYPEDQLKRPIPQASLENLTECDCLCQIAAD